jgi:succinate dehydrogenase/fumarate reductase cytochrome b subunit (b558 family)
MHWTNFDRELTLVRMVAVQDRVRRAPASVWLKFVMGSSGLVMFLYLVLHMIGNLKIFLGADPLDTYARWLRTVGEPAVPEETVLWIVRVVLGLALVGHLVSAAILTGRAPSSTCTASPFRAATPPARCGGAG